MSAKLPDGLQVRNSKPTDHQPIISVMNDWWGGRDLSWMLPKLFLVHFNNSSFIIEKDGELVAFLIGFLSQARFNEGYIHFAGVHPAYRGTGLGRNLYNRFFQICRDHGRDTIRACTSPVNIGSIEFHRKLGFDILPGDTEIEGIPVTLNYNKPNDPKVLFQTMI